tara:strand:+ start:696 stop:1916 length:1221 start_codon:yes stop_codon:yes gene_type:complete
VKGSAFPRFRTIAFWAFLDLRGEARLSFLTGVLIAALLTPALVMTIARVSVVEGWTEMLATDPRNREVRVIGEYEVDAPMIAALDADPGVGFYVKETSRFINSVRFQAAAGRARVSDVRTTRAGDPILDGMTPPDDDQVSLTEAAADDLGVTNGDLVTLLLRREPKNRPIETAEIGLVVSGIIPETIWPDSLALLSENRSAGVMLWSARPGDPRPPLYDPETETETPWKSLRVYAMRVAQAPELQNTLRSAPFSFDTQLNSDQVVKLVRLSEGLGALSWTLTLLSATGFAVSVLLLQRLGVARKAETLALMSVAGLSRRDMVAFLVTQSGMLALAGLLLTVLIIAPMQPLIGLLAEAMTPGVPAATIDWRLPLTGSLMAFAVTLVFSLWATRDIRHLDLPRLLRSD